MTSKEAFDILSGNNQASLIVGRIVGRQKYIEALQVIKQNLDKLEKIEKIIEDHEKYKLKPYKPADDYIRQIKEVFKCN